jgi:hypothetical protein
MKFFILQLLLSILDSVMKRWMDKTIVFNVAFL